MAAHVAAVAAAAAAASGNVSTLFHSMSLGMIFRCRDGGRIEDFERPDANIPACHDLEHFCHDVAPGLA